MVSYDFGSGINFPLIGREKIYTVCEDITRDNVVDVLREALWFHNQNMLQEEYLYYYCRGAQPIIAREKKIRPEINNKVVQNVASEIVSFKNGYFLTQPTFYKGADDASSEDVNNLNKYLRLSGKHSADNAVVDWFHTVGVGALFVESTEGKAPCRTYALDPRNAFVIYSRRPGNRPVMGVYMVKVKGADGINRVHYDCYTEESKFEIIGGFDGTLSVEAGNKTLASIPFDIVYEGTNITGSIPIIEYAYDRHRRSAFEIVLPLLDSINLVQSNRLDGVEQFIQSLMLLINCELPVDEDGNKSTANEVREQGLIELKNVAGLAQADVRILSEQLDQSQTQTLLDDLMKNVCDIAGMPMTSATSAGTSDNVGAVYLRNGFAQADTQARVCEDLFKESDKLFDEIFLKILQIKELTTLEVEDIDIQFTRNEMENMQSKTQTALGLKTFGLAPELCLSKSGISNDPVGDIQKSKGYIEKAFEREGANNGKTDEGSGSED